MGQVFRKVFFLRNCQKVVYLVILSCWRLAGLFHINCKCTNLTTQGVRAYNCWHE